MRVLVTGAAGLLGTEVVRVLTERSASRVRDRLEVVAADRTVLDVTNRGRVLEALATLEPDVVFNLAAFTNVDACESEPERAFAVNALAVRHLAEGARHAGSHLVHVSTDYVFDGTSTRPYTEWDGTNPMSTYGRSKLGGELECDPSATVVRTSWLVGRSGSNMARTVLALARASSEPLRFVDDQVGSPTVASDLAERLVDLGLGRRPGCFHVTNQGSTSWYGFARHVCEAAGFGSDRVLPIATAELVPARPAPRPAYSVLDNAALRAAGDPLLAHWQESVSRLVPDLHG
jgi:dTDP-4-dehydrorhamnose reductase